MLKSFKEYKDNELLLKFQKKFFHFFNEIKKHDHQVEEREANEHEYKYRPVTCLLQSNRINIIVVNNRVRIFTINSNSTNDYPFIMKYILSELSPYVDVIFKDNVDYYFDVNLLTNDIVNGINLSKERYEIFKDTERFGL